MEGLKEALDVAEAIDVVVQEISQCDTYEDYNNKIEGINEISQNPNVDNTEFLSEIAKVSPTLMTDIGERIENTDLEKSWNEAIDNNYSSDAYEIPEEKGLSDGEEVFEKIKDSIDQYIEDAKEQLLDNPNDVDKDTDSVEKGFEAGESAMALGDMVDMNTEDLYENNSDVDKPESEFDNQSDIEIDDLDDIDINTNSDIEQENLIDTEKEISDIESNNTPDDSATVVPLDDTEINEKPDDINDNNSDKSSNDNSNDISNDNKMDDISHDYDNTDKNNSDTIPEDTSKDDTDDNIEANNNNSDIEYQNNDFDNESSDDIENDYDSEAIEGFAID